MTTTDDENDDDELPEDDDSLEDDCVPFDVEGTSSRETSVETSRRMSKTNSNGSSFI